MSEEKAVKVKYRQPLVEFDFPIIALFTSHGDKRFFIGCSIPDEEGEVDHYFVVSVQPATLKAYLREKYDLRFLFENAKKRRFYTTTVASLEADETLLVPFEGELEERLLPRHRFFARSHTHQFEGLELVANSDPETLYVDGSWDMPEFGEFYRKFSDLYAICAAKVWLASNHRSQEVVKKIKTAIRTKPFKGGASYLGFFNDIRESLPYFERPRLNKVYYASPGQIDLLGTQEVFCLVEALLDGYEDNRQEIVETHSKLRRYLSDSGFLNMKAENVSLTPEQFEVIKSLAVELDQKMNSNLLEVLLPVVENDYVVASKILLSVFRRLFSAANFFDQGRVGYDPH